MPRTAKKIGIKILLGLFRGLMMGKRLLIYLLRSLREPFAALWKSVLHPVLTWGYQVYRTIKRAVFKVLEPIQDSATGFLTSKYAVHAIVVIVSFFVTATNIAASDAVPSLDPEVGNDPSVIARMTQSDYETLVIEEADDVAFAQDITYLGTYALSASQFYETESSYLGTDDGLYDDTADDGLAESHVDNAISASPDAGTDGSRTRTRTEQHVVQDGENIGAIARAYDLTTQTILQANGLNVRSVIRPGQTLDIPVIDGVTYTVRSGDTLNAIANKYDADVEDIMEFNGIASSASLRVGEEIILPGGRIPAAPAPAPVRPSTSVASIFTVPPDADPDASTTLLWPTAATRITQYYKYGHTGVDIAGPVGTAIYAADDGVVSYSGWNSGGYGNMTIVDHGNGLYTRYAHATKNLFKAGDVVHRGEVIALMGSTGRSTGPHLHFEVMRGGIYSRVNPFDYIQ